MTPIWGDLFKCSLGEAFHDRLNLEHIPFIILICKHIKVSISIQSILFSNLFCMCSYTVIEDFYYLLYAMDLFQLFSTFFPAKHWLLLIYAEHLYSTIYIIFWLLS